MSQAEDIRKFAITNYIAPARARGEKRVVIRVGDVHRDMKLENAVPAVCSAIGSAKFWDEAGVRQVGREGPPNSTTVLFTFDLEGASVFDVAVAEMELRNRYGDASVDTAKMISFDLPDGRAVALQRDIAKVQLWIEDDNRTGAPGVEEMRRYEADRGRHSNLPDRLTDKPSAELRKQGFPKSVLSLRVSDESQLKSVLDWYEQTTEKIDLQALEKLKSIFIANFPDFEKRGFEAGQGGYWDTERNYKQTLIDRAKEVMDRADKLEDAALGSELLAILNSPESNFLGWRMTNRLSAVRNENAGLLEAAVGQLVRSSLDPPAAVDEFVRAVWSAYAKGQEGNMPYRDIRTIPTTVLALAKPAEAMGVRYQPIHAAGMRLLHRSLLKNAPFSAAEYRDVLSMTEAIASVMRNQWGWHPRDLWDVQGFVWTTCRSSENDVDTEDEPKMAQLKSSAGVATPRNLILYGPPGTGKTYATISEAVMLCDGALPGDGSRLALMLRYNALKEAGRIAFVTFHQSYSYEDFVEGLRPETDAEDDEESARLGGFRLKPVAGIFKRISALAEQAAVIRSNAPTLSRNDPNFFKMSLGARDQSEIYQAAIKGEYIALGWGSDIDWSDPAYENRDAILEKWRTVEPDIGATGRVSQTYRLRATMREGDIVIVSDGNNLFRAVGEIVGPYMYVAQADEFRHRRKVRWLRVLEKSLPIDTILEGKFTQGALYLIDPTRVKRAALESILAADTEPQNVDSPRQPDPYVLIVDEINRANISKVFGELITLIEPDKRLGQENALTVILPYSGEPFGVPRNLHIVGTMNTADRSIALLDTALRRRFEFRELMPLPELLKDVDGIDLCAVLTTLNKRIEYVFDREHQIGHAYFMGCSTKSNVDSVMRAKVIPLLSEYFYENWEKVRQVLGETKDDGGFVVRTKLDPPKGTEGDPGNDRWRYTVRDQFTVEAYSQLLT